MLMNPTIFPIILIVTCSVQADIHEATTLNTPITTTPLTSQSPSKKSLIGGGHSYRPCGTGKQCVRSYFCANGKMRTDGASIINIRFDEDSICPFLEECCSLGDQVEDPILSPFDTPAGCGYRNLEGVGFRIEGNHNNEAEFGEFPWMVGILLEELSNSSPGVFYSYKCGGSLITPQVVLTAAHCVNDSQEIKYIVRAGEWETNSRNEIWPDQNRNVREVIAHPNYNKENLFNDIALLFLISPFDKAPHINTICLPPAGHNFDYSRCYATGWGNDKFENGDLQNILKKIDMPIVPNSLCQDELRQTRLSKYFILNSSFMCAGGERGKDTCTGDGGSPLMCPISGQSNRYYQAGIVAWGIGCGHENVPGVYANVSYLRGWIDDQLACKGIDKSFYTL